MPPSSSKTILPAESDQSVAPLAFIPVDAYTTFRAEYAVVDDDIVFHFYRPPESSAATAGPYWEHIFPAALEVTAKDVFRAAFPRLKAKRVDDPEIGIDSWWFRAYGFAVLLDPHPLVHRFVEALDAALDSTNRK